MANYGKGRKSYPEWSDKELDAIQELFPRAQWPQLLAALPNRSRGSINQMGRNILKIHREINRRPHWTAEEVAILRRVYPAGTDKELKTALSRHSFIAIQRQACALKILRPRREAREHRRLVLPVIAQLYQARLAQHMRRPTLAKKLGYAHGQILGWELGKTAPSFRVVMEWAQALGFEIHLRPKLSVSADLPSVIGPPDKRRLMAGRA